MESEKYAKSVAAANVAKSNYLNERAYKLGVQSQKLLCIFIALVNSKRLHGKSYWVTYRELVNLLNLDTSKNAKSEILKAIHELTQSGMFQINDHTYTVWLSSVSFKDGIVLFDFPEIIEIHLKNFQKDFVKYRLGNVLPLKTSYSIRIYEIMAQNRYKTIASPVYDLEKFKAMVGAENKYPNYKDFRKRVIDPSLNEINKKTDLEVSFRPIKSGKQIVSIEFKIKRKETLPESFLKKFEELKTEKLQTTQDYTLKNPEKNNPSFNLAYENFIKTRNRYPNDWTFEDYVKQLGGKLNTNSRNGIDLIIE